MASTGALVHLAAVREDRCVAARMASGVNGDAELVVCCDYRTRATESEGQIKLTGAIDMPEIRDEITEVMEGGVDAFKLRYQKYGF